MSDIRLKKIIVVANYFQKLKDLVLKGNATELEAQLTKDNISTRDEVSSFIIEQYRHIFYLTNCISLISIALDVLIT